MSNEFCNTLVVYCLAHGGCGDDERGGQGMGQENVEVRGRDHKLVE